MSQWSPKLVVRALAIGAVALGAGAVLGRVVGHERPPERVRRLGGGPAAPGSQERALVAPLEPGGALADFRIDSISSVGDGAFVVGCARGPELVRLTVALDGGPARAPASAAGYAIYYFADRATGARDQDGARLAQALAAVIARNAAKPRPNGLGTFAPDSR